MDFYYSSSGKGDFFLWGSKNYFIGARKHHGLCCGCLKGPVNETAVGNHFLSSAPKEEETFVPW